MRTVCLVVILWLANLSDRQSHLHIIKIEGMDFTPKQLSIKAGDQVRWINESDGSHNVIANDGSFKSSMLESKGQTFEFTFTRSGTFNYYCKPHRIMGMKGTITVQ